MRLKNSLLNKYLLLILLAMVLVPFSFPLVTVLFYTIPEAFGAEKPASVYRSGVELEKQWHAEARKLQGASAEQIDERLHELKRIYPDAAMFWVNAQGRTQLQLDIAYTLPQQWSFSDMLQYMKQSYAADPFTVIAYIGEQREAFMVLQLDREIMRAETNYTSSQYSYVIILGTFVILAIFLTISFLFFYRIRRRLLQLQEAMTSPGASGIPEPTPVVNPDEIGRLEKAFNEMINKLEAGRKREQEEEVLRRELIASLSHDLRTPLTTIRGHAYSLRMERLSEQGRQSVELIDRKADYLGQLIENLLSYTLLSAGKYPYRAQRLDLTRLVREAFANWYPVFERERFTIELQLPEQPVMWQVDPQWLERILDNLLQNILNHALEGRYVSVKLAPRGEGTELTIEDRGPGLKAVSAGKGAGIGLSIVDLMLREMKLEWEKGSAPEGRGTLIRIRNLNRN